MVERLEQRRQIVAPDALEPFGHLKVCPTRLPVGQRALDGVADDVVRHADPLDGRRNQSAADEFTDGALGPTLWPPHHVGEVLDRKRPSNDRQNRQDPGRVRPRRPQPGRDQVIRFRPGVLGSGHDADPER
jgi:hypothetical protein